MNEILIPPSTSQDAPVLVRKMERGIVIEDAADGQEVVISEKQVPELIEALHAVLGDNTFDLRRAIDDLWGSIAKPELETLDPRTIEVAMRNHDLLWHEDDQET